MNLAESLPVLASLLKKWGLDSEDWILTGQYPLLLQGFDVSVRRGHHNIVVDKSKLPWKIDPIAAEIFPPFNSKYGHDYQEFINNTDFDLDIILTTTREFYARKKNTVPYQLLDKQTILLQDPWGLLEEVEAILALCNEKGWGKEKGVRLLRWFEELVEVYKNRGHIDLSNAYFDVLGRYSHIKSTGKQNKSSSILGLSAFKGKTKGKARIISDESEFINFKKGEVLVTKSTSPRFSYLIAKASAVVTDEGGILCHAAIVCRELKKPAIVGTKNATRDIRTGDLVEVDANIGKVKILG